MAALPAVRGREQVTMAATALRRERARCCRRDRAPTTMRTEGRCAHPCPHYPRTCNLIVVSSSSTFHFASPVFPPPRLLPIIFYPSHCCCIFRCTFSSSAQGQTHNASQVDCHFVFTFLSTCSVSKPVAPPLCRQQSPNNATACKLIASSRKGKAQVRLMLQ
jgi:hypothetical protein